MMNPLRDSCKEQKSPRATASAPQAWLEFLVMMQRLHKLMTHREVLPVTDAEYMVMLRLDSSENGEMSPTELSLSGIITKSAVSKMLNGMEQKGYILRTREKKDRRNLTVSLTPLGREVYRRAADIVETSFQEVSDRMGQEETGQLLVLAKRWVDCMEDTAAARSKAQKPDVKNGENSKATL